MENLTLEQEFEVAKNNHMLQTCRIAIEQELEQKINSTISIPAFLLKDQIRKEVVSRINNALHTNTFNTLYENSWEEVKGMLAP